MDITYQHSENYFGDREPIVSDWGWLGQLQWSWYKLISSPTINELYFEPQVNESSLQN